MQGYSWYPTHKPSDTRYCRQVGSHRVYLWLKFNRSQIDLLEIKHTLQTISF